MKHRIDHIMFTLGAVCGIGAIYGLWIGWRDRVKSETKGVER